MSKFSKLVEIMEILRGENGCAWDIAQDLVTLRQYLIEESYEVLEMIDREDYRGLKEELGDLMFEIIFISKIASDMGKFGIDDVIEEILEKMIRRHPHVFGNTKAETPEQVSSNWRKIKINQENRKYDSALGGLPKTLPALFMSHKLTRQAARVNFDWDNIEAILEKLQEEIDEFKRAHEGGNREEIEAEIGDILFAGANIARFLNINPEIALINANRRFVERFQYIEKRLIEQKKDIEKTPLDEMEALWEEAKNTL